MSTPLSPRFNRSNLALRLVLLVGVICALAGGAGWVYVTTDSTPSASTRHVEGPPPPAGFERKEVEVGGARISYVEGGEGPALVLLHGWPQTWWAWRGVMPGLAKSHTVISMDLPGLGESTARENQALDPVSVSRQIRAALRKMGHTEVSLMGHDIGSMVAFTYARDYADEVDKLAIVATPIFGTGLENSGAPSMSWHMLFNASPAPIPEEIMDDADVAHYLGMVFGQAKMPNRIAQKEYVRTYRDARIRSASYEYFRSIPQHIRDNKKKAHKTLPMPVLAVGGGTFSHAVEQSLRPIAPDLRGVVAPGSGHFVAEERPGFLTRCASAFFASDMGQQMPACVA